MGKQTDKIFEEIQTNTSNEESVPFIEDTGIRDELRNDIDRTYQSRGRLASDCAISPSQLSEFLNGTKNLNRDKLLAIFICLGYNLDQIQTLLRRFAAPELYVRRKRDYQIAVGIKAKNSLDIIDETLLSKGFEPLGQYSSDRGAGTK